MSIQKIIPILIFILSLFASCNNSSDLADAIPLEASYVVHIDGQSLIKKSDYNIFKNSKVQQAISFVKILLKDDAQIAMLDNFIKDPNSIGIDITKDSYFYRDKEVFGFILGINDSKKAQKTILNLTRVQEEDIIKDGNIHIISPEPALVVSWNNEKLLILVDKSNKSDLQKLAKVQLQQNSQSSIRSNPSFAEFLKNNKDISVYSTVAGVEDGLSYQMKYTGIAFPAYLSQIFNDFKGISAGGFVSFEKGKIAYSSKYFYKDAATKDKFREIVENLLGKVQGTQIKYIDPSSIFVMSLNIKGENMNDYLSKLGVLGGDVDSSSLISEEDMKSLLNTVNGDVTFALTDIKEPTTPYSSFYPQYAFLADITEPSTVSDLIKKIVEQDSIPITKISTSIYQFKGENMPIYFGTSDKMFFITNDDSIYSKLTSSKNLPDNSYSKIAEGNLAFAKGNLKPLKKLIEGERGAEYIIPFLDEMDSYEAKMSDKTLENQGELNLKTTDKNSLAVICLLVDNLLNELDASSLFQ